MHSVMADKTPRPITLINQTTPFLVYLARLLEIRAFHRPPPGSTHALTEAGRDGSGSGEDARRAPYAGLCVRSAIGRDHGCSHSTTVNADRKPDGSSKSMRIEIEAARGLMV